MVEFEEIVEETPPPTTTTTTNSTTSTPKEEEEEPLMSAERKLDAQELDQLASQAIRPTVKAHISSLADKLRRDAAALERMEASKAKAASSAASGSAAAAPAPQDSTPAVEATPTPTPTPTVRPVEVTPTPAPAPPSSTTSKYTPISRFSFDAGSSSDPFVTIYIPLTNVGTIPKSQINCTFTNTSFDLTIEGLEGKDYRLVKDNLDKDIVGEDCKLKIRANKIILKLAKVKSEYGSFDFWTDLTSKKSKKETEKKKNSDPSAGIMDLMKDMYDSGDDQMKKTIAEAMMKSRSGELDNKPPGGGMGGMGGMGGLDGMGDLGM